MIRKLKGIVDELLKEGLILEVNNIGYLIYCSNYTLNGLVLGTSLSLFIEMQVTENQITLYGFKEELERQWFNRLITVKGVGGKVALAILSVISAEKLSNVIISQDKATLLLAAGVGSKLADRIILELKSNNALANFVTSTASNNIINDATSALANLGYSRQEAYRVSHKLYEMDNNLDISNLIKHALKELG